MQLLLGVVRCCLQAVRSKIMAWSAERPGLALFIIILATITLLPLITATALMPIVFLLDLSNFVATKGIFSIVYSVLFQGLVLGLILVVLFFAAFAIASSASVLHSYKYFYTIKN